ncbi:XRE family transcriptional regulator [Ligilactobacillus ruminis]|uniref:XRE family transcriptional regulator n=1 Tax=Ligilactobacillus ruminis TaxID=1623 RepID=A0AAQ3AU06_9LACO|nr:XRE family transcriptional regulator [Ligilactobacillus ruminis]WDC82499.1 XRE family transcriptional regulator [Ligilactobacillus ruminis]
MKLTTEQLKLLRRRKGELNTTILALAENIGIGRISLSNALKGQSINKKNVERINDWLIKQSLKDD